MDILFCLLICICLLLAVFLITVICDNRIHTKKLAKLTADYDQVTEGYKILLNRDKLKDEEIKALLAAPKEKVLTTDAQQLLHDMTTHGNAIVRIVPLSPENLFYRSPK